MKMAFRIIALIHIISFSLLSSLLAQKEANVWYFGVNAGIDFNSGSPVPLMNGALSTTEGCSSISDSSGNVLFYTCGENVWNQNHIQMPNGFGLLGSFSATQSALIVPKPNSDSLYYIFTVDDWAFVPAHDGLRYSIVDMSLQSGLGDLSIKNVLIDTPMTERITAVRHCNDVDVWVLSHEWGSDAFYAYLVTAAGISSPIISNVGSPHNFGSDFAGCMKASPDGSKLAVALYFSKKFELFDFDNSTGVVSNPISMYSLNYDGAYGVEFSQDGTKLYGATLAGIIFQFDLLAGSSIDIINSAWVVGTSDTVIMALQLGPDGKIYVARNYGYYLGVIEYPNISGILCNYIDTAVFLAGRICRGGLPSSVQSYFYKPSFSFAYNNTCIGDTTGFAISDTITIVSVIWNFDDTISGSLNSSTMLSPSHIFSSAGSYNVKLIVYYNCRIDTVLESVIINSLPFVSTGNDTTLCIGDSAILIATGGISYLWNTGDTTASITVSPDSTTSYSVNVSDGVCSASDSIFVIVKFVPPATILNFDICTGDSVLAGGSYQTTSGTYYDTLAAPSICDSVIISNLYVEPLPIIDLGEDMSISADTSIILNAENPGASYIWSTGHTTQTITISEQGTYSVTVTDNNGCSNTDKILITVIPREKPEIIIYNTFTPNNDVVNDTWFIENMEFYKDSYIEIYNRNGNLVFSAEHYQNDWDGKYNNKDLPAATYYYIIDLGESFDKTYKGFVTIIR